MNIALEYASKEAALLAQELGFGTMNLPSNSIPECGDLIANDGIANGGFTKSRTFVVVRRFWLPSDTTERSHDMYLLLDIFDNKTLQVL